jgi:hypothetical protein
MQKHSWFSQSIGSVGVLMEKNAVALVLLHYCSRMENLHLEIDRKDHGVTRLVDEPLPVPGPGQVRLRVDRFALTANTVTYATTGDLLGYWDFYPSGNPDWGRVPAMGWAEVVATAHPDVPVGGRYSGWYPMSRYVDVLVKPTPDGLRDEGPHRAAHAPVYRAFAATDSITAFAEVYDNQRGPAHTVYIATTVAAEDGRVLFREETSRPATDLKGGRGALGHTVRLPLRDLGTGEFVLKIQARSSLGAEAGVTREVPFRVR